MPGLATTGGAFLDGWEHVQQSIAVILKTPIGTRGAMRRDFGSRLPYLIDAPLNDQTALAIYAEVADALKKWEPRFRLTRVQLGRGAGRSRDDLKSGRVELKIQGIYFPNGHLGDYATRVAEDMAFSLIVR